MKIMKNMSKRMNKSFMALLMCVVMMLSLISTSSISYATEADTTTNNQTTTSEDNSQTGTSTSNNNSTSTNTDPNGTLGKNSEVGIELTKSITGKSGKSVTVAFVLKSNDPTTIKLKSVYPVIDTAFPFETSGDAYKIISADDAEKQKTLEATFKMTARNDLATGYHSVRFIGEYQKVAADGSVKDFYVIKTINIYFTNGSSESKDDSDDKKQEEDEKDEDTGNEDLNDDSFDDSDSYDDGGSSYDNGGSEAEAVAPKLIVTGYKTEPEKIMAGQTFKITIHIQNTSKVTNVCNGKFLIGNEAGSFTPTNGSNAVFVESIKAGETGDIVMEMKAGADLSQKNYSLVIKGDFDDGRGNNFTSSDSLTLPVYQKVDFNITEVSMTPEVLGVGEEGSLMFTINNQSTAGVYNVNINVKDPAVTATETYVGNIAGSSSAYATLLVTGVEENPDKGKITIEITYEDSEGNKETIAKNVACVVGEGMGLGDGTELDEFEAEFEDEEYYDDEESTISPILIVVIVLVVMGIIAGVITFLVLRRKKRMAELLAEEDGEDDLYDENF